VTFGLAFTAGRRGFRVCSLVGRNGERRPLPKLQKAPAALDLSAGAFINLSVRLPTSKF
jgi:hypothetical protein